MRLSKWTHPKTGQTRIYVNDDIIGYGVTVFVVDGGPSGTAKYHSDGFPDIVIQSRTPLDSQRLDIIYNSIDEHVRNTSNLNQNPVFSDYLALCGG